MCLGIPGQIIDVLAGQPHRATADIGGARREVNTLLLDDGDELRVGDWVLIHVGFAMARIDAAEAARSWRELETMIEAHDRADATDARPLP